MISTNLKKPQELGTITETNTLRPNAGSLECTPQVINISPELLDHFTRKSSNHQFSGDMYGYQRGRLFMLRDQVEVYIPVPWSRDRE